MPNAKNEHLQELQRRAVCCGLQALSEHEKLELITVPVVRRHADPETCTFSRYECHEVPVGGKKV